MRDFVKINHTQHKNYHEKKLNFERDQTESNSEYSSDSCVYASVRNLHAIADGTLLNVYAIDKDEANNKCELLGEVEFEHAINCIAWSESGNGLVVGDIRGTVFLLTTFGQVLFTKTLLAGKISFSLPTNRSISN